MKTKQRGSAWSIKLVYNLYRLFGYKFIYYLMYPVSYFYYLKASNVKEALSIYYKHIGREFTPRAHREHLRHFAICMCDRFISLVAPNAYSFDIEDREIFEHDLGQGAILLLAHYGGWASCANCAGYLGLKINIVMQEVLAQGIKDIEESLGSHTVSHINIIDTNKGGIAATMEIAKALGENELVAMMADRATSKKNSKKAHFFGKEGNFNKNPFEIAYKTDKPLIALFISYLGSQHYKIDYITMTMNKDANMAGEVDTSLRQYVKRFEMNIKQYPQGWFNFYDFWEK